MFYRIAIAGLLMLAATSASANPLANLKVVDCRTHNVAQEDADRALADKAMALLQKRNVAAVGQMMPDLETAFAHAPDVPSFPERCGDQIISYGGDTSQTLMLAALASKDGKSVGIVQKPALPYASLAFIIGWTRFEARDYASAHAAYEKGLKNDPDSTPLVIEDTLTLAYLHRSEEGLALVDGFLTNHDDLPDSIHAALLRKKGYVLVELKRWDEAETAYKASLTFAPGDAIAQGELQYIAGQKSKLGASAPAT